MRNTISLLTMGLLLAGAGCGRETPGQAETKPSAAVAPGKTDVGQPQAPGLPPPLVLPPSLEHVLLEPAPSILTATRPGDNAPPPPLILPVSVTQPTTASDLPLPPGAVPTSSVPNETPGTNLPPLPSLPPPATPTILPPR